LINVIVHNSFVLFKQKNPASKHKLLDFRKHLTTGIITHHSSGHRHTPPGSGDAPARLRDRHFPVLIPSTTTMTNPLRECRVCGASQRMENVSESKPDTCV